MLGGTNVGRRSRPCSASSWPGTAPGFLELVELGWHDCYDEISPPDDIVDDILFLSQGDIVQLIHAAHLAITDRRDLQLAVEDLRRRA